MTKKFNKLATLASALTLCATMATGCQKETAPEIVVPSNAVIIVNEGNFMAGNADLSVYDLETRQIQNNIFGQANNQAAMGDSPAAAVYHKNTLLVTLSASGKIYGIDTSTFALASKITSLGAPRKILIESDTRGYISNLNINRIDIFDPSTMQITGEIDLGDDTGTDFGGTPVEIGSEDMVMLDKMLYTNQWSYGNAILKVDPQSGKVLQKLEVGKQPVSLVADKNGDLWTLCDGGYVENPSLHHIKINPLTGMMSTNAKYELPNRGAYHQKMIIGADKATLFFLNDGLFKMSILDKVVPANPFIYMTRTPFYNLAEDGRNGDLYVTYAADYQSNGMVYRYSAGGDITDKLEAGIIPSLLAF